MSTLDESIVEEVTLTWFGDIARRLRLEAIRSSTYLFYSPIA